MFKNKRKQTSNATRHVRFPRTLGSLLLLGAAHWFIERPCITLNMRKFARMTAKYASELRTLSRILLGTTQQPLRALAIR